MQQAVTQLNSNVRHIVRTFDNLVLCKPLKPGLPVRWLPEEQKDIDNHIMTFHTSGGAIRAAATHGGRPVHQTKEL
jgi:hypothetical protein